MSLVDDARDYIDIGEDMEAVELIEAMLNTMQETLEGVRHELTKTGDIEHALLLIHRAIGS